MRRKINRFVAGLLLLGLAALVAHTLLTTREHTVDATTPALEVTLATGVVYRAISTGTMSGVDIVDVDLTVSKARLALGVAGIKRGADGVTGRSYTPAQWLQQSKGLAAVNGGYFGEAESLDREQVVGLLVEAGQTIQGQRSISGRGGRYVERGRYVRSAFGITPTGVPSIAWVGTTGSTAMSYSSPTNLSDGKRWRVREALGCGPTLIANGRIDVTDHAERLVSEGDLPRTFVAYDTVRGKPRDFVMGVASSMSYQTLAAFIAGYFVHFHHAKAARAMCFDGGPSSQLSYLGAGGIVSPRQTDVAVPVVLLLLSK